MSARIKVSLIKCGRCGKRYSNPLTHTCVTRIGRRPGKMRIGARVTRDCPKCKRPVTNPVIHVCKVKTDFRRKTAAAKKSRAQDKRRQAASVAKVAKARAAGPGKQRHDYRSCRDEHCARVACVAYRDGDGDGYERGHEAGYQRGDKAGYQRGWNTGFPAGMAACPRNHE